jgi:hypothetical protein
MKKPRTLRNLQDDPRLETIEPTYSKEAPWVATTKKPFMFHGNSRTILGTIKEICEDTESLVEVSNDIWYD